MAMQKTMLMQSIPIPMAIMLMPCVVSSMLMPFSCPVVTVADTHGTDTHKPDSDAVTGIHAADAMNQIPIEPMPIPIPCVASSGGDRHL